MNTSGTPERSSQLSDTSLSAQNEPPEFDPTAYVYFLDESISMKSVKTALLNAGVKVKVLKDEFYLGALDVVWLPTATTNGWILLTKDDRWRYRLEEKRILIENKARAFVFVSKSATAEETAETLVKCLPKMAQIIATTPAPFIAHILLSGHINLVFPKDDEPDSSPGPP